MAGEGLGSGLMPGPTPKHPSQRRRRNAEPVSGQRLSESAPKRKAPTTPKGLLRETQAWWRTVWASPMAAVWLDADVPAVARLARLLDARARGKGIAAELSEIRQLEDRFGLSPLARRRLQWEVDRARDREHDAAARAAETAGAAAAADPDSNVVRFQRAAGQGDG